MTSDVLAIVGSTEFEHPAALAAAGGLIRAVMLRRVPHAVVSGGADGIDHLAAQVAREFQVEVREHLPANPRWEPDGYKARNLLIARDCTRLLAIRCHASKTYGSGWTADQAADMGKPVWRITL